MEHIGALLELLLYKQRDSCSCNVAKTWKGDRKAFNLHNSTYSKNSGANPRETGLAARKTTESLT